MSEEKDTAERAKELLVYGPIGLALYLRDTAPSFLKLFVARGRNELEQRRRDVGDQLDQARTLGENAAATGAPQVLRMMSEGIAAVRERAEDALEALGVRSGEEGASPQAVPAPPRLDHAPARTMASGGETRPNLAIPGYDDLSASQVVDRLEGLRPEELEAIRAYETARRARNTILGKIEQLTREG